MELVHIDYTGSRLNRFLDGKNRTLAAISSLNDPTFLWSHAECRSLYDTRRLFPYMTALDHLTLGRFVPRAKTEREKLIDYVFEFSRFRERQNQLSRTFSGGAAIDVSDGAGVDGEPGDIDVDEPSLGLAPILVEEDVFKTIGRIHGEGKSVLLIEQHVHEAFTYCSRGYVLENGRFILNGGGKLLLANNYLKKTYLGL